MSMRFKFSDFESKYKIPD